MLRGFLWYKIIVFYPRKHINKISCIKLSIYVCDNCVFKYEYDFENSYSYDTLTIKIKIDICCLGLHFEIGIVDWKDC